MKDIYIVGAGGMGREVAFLIEEINKIKPTWNIVGFIDDNQIYEKTINDYKVLGNCEYLRTIINDNVNIVIAVGQCHNKISIKQKLDRINEEFTYPVLIHPNVIIGKNATISNGTIIMPNVVIEPNVSIGEHVFIATASCIMHDVTIGNNCDIMLGAKLAGFCSIGNCCFIGESSTILPGIKVRDNKVIEPGVVVK